MSSAGSIGNFVGALAQIEARKVKAYVPGWPWRPIGWAMRALPLSVVRRLG